MRREYPHGLQIQITERVPLARVVTDGEECSLLAEGGVFVSGPCAEWEDLMQISGMSPSDTTPGARFPEETVTELLENLQAATVSGLTVRTVDASDVESIELIDESGTRVLLGALSVAAARIRFLEALCREVDIGNYELIDLRFGGEATLVPRVRR